MKHVLLVCSFICYTLANAQTETFAKKKSLKDDIATRHSNQMVAYGGKLYFFGGYNQGGANSSQVVDFWEYTPTTKTFRQLQDPPLAFYDQAALVVGNKMYVGLTSTSFYEYDFATGSWTQRPNFPGTTGNGKTSSFIINDTIFAASSSSIATFYSYNVLTNTWTPRANFPGTPRGACFSFSVNGKGYLGGGINPSNNTAFMDFYEYNPTTNTWTSKSALSFSTKASVSETVAGKAYVGTGILTTGVSNGTWKEYDAVTDTWTNKAQLPVVHNAASASVGTDIFVFAGSSFASGLATTNNKLSRYNTLTNIWSIDSSATGGNRSYANTFYSNNKIYVAAGEDGSTYNDMWEYDLSTDSWTRKADLPTNFSHRAQAKIGTKLYTVGGYKWETAGYSNELLEYDISSNSWATKTAFPAALRNMSAFTINNELYAGLGFNGSSTGLQTYKGLYKYNFTTNTWQALTSCPKIGSGSTSGTFVMADTAYVIFDDGEVYGYNRIANTWSQKASKANFTNASHEQALVLNGNAYIIDQQDGSSNLLSLKKYSAASNTWNTVRRNLNINRKLIHNAAVVDDSTFYVGLGYSVSFAPPNKTGINNDWYKFSFKADIATKVGDVAATPMDLWNNESYTVYDSLGGLLIGAVGGTATSISSVSGRSVDTLLPYREKLATISSGGNLQNVMFLNKNFLANSSFQPGARIRLYFTNREIAKFVSTFNAKYGTSFTEGNIRFLNNNNLNSANDLNPLNNDANYVYSYPFDNIVGYGATGKYFELTVPVGGIAGEMYAILYTTNWALPLSLLNFTASAGNNCVETKWQTVSEKDFSHFNVHRSMDGTNFNAIGKIDASNSIDGNTKNYQYADSNAIGLGKSKLYYRLQMVNKNGSFAFSSIAVINLSAKNNVIISPNPASDYITISGSSWQTIQVYDFMGRLVKTVNANDNYTTCFSIASLAKGNYQLKLMDRKGNTETRKIVKQ